MNTGGPAFPHGPLGDSIQYEDGRISHQWQGSTGMDLLDWMAGQALAGLYGAANDQSYKMRIDGNEPIKRSDVARDCYSMASAMLAEKARREGDHSKDTLGKVAALEAANRELVEALRFMVRSCAPNKKEHPALFAAREYAVSALSKAKGVA